MQSLKQVSWKRLAQEVKARTALDNVSNGGAALAFYLTLAIFPALIFLLSLLPFLPIPNLDRAIMDFLHQGLPGEAASLLEDTVRTLVNERQGGLLSLGFIGTIWAASSGMYAIMQQLNITYDVKEERPFVKARATALLLTLLFGLLVIGGFGLIVGGGALQEWIGQNLGWSQGLLLAFAGLRWVIILAFLLLAFSVIYYFGPNTEQRFRWISPGAVFGVLMLLAASLLFRFYIESFGNYAATYGSLGAVVILMLWLYVAGLVLLLGSEINVAFERQMAGARQGGNRRVRRDEASSAPRSSGPSPA